MDHIDSLGCDLNYDMEMKRAGRHYMVYWRQIDETKTRTKASFVPSPRRLRASSAMRHCAVHRTTP
jgi:hypothetical protein